MTEKYQNKYRIPSARLQNWDYGWNAAYFVTICTQNREHYFGEIIETQCIASLPENIQCIPSLRPQMQLSKIGNIVETEWVKTFEMRPDMNLQMGEFVIMPNHFHAIIIIGENEYNTQRGIGGETDHETGANRRDAMHCVSTTNVAKNKFGPQSKNLAPLIRSFKIGVTKNARLIHTDFAWQSRFHDHIIRNEQSFKTISEYIINNPANWHNDKFNVQ